jgi:hypothetical protein
MGVDHSDPSPFADRSNPPMGSTTVESLAVVTQQDRSVDSFAHGQVDRASGARHQRNQSELVALADDAQRAMSSFEGYVLDVGSAGLGDPETVQPEQHGERGVRVVESFGGEQEPA